MSEGVEGQVAWRAGGRTLVRVVPSFNACPAAPKESDLVPGVYEGGLKVWEASLDLVDYLVTLGIGATEEREGDTQDNARPAPGGEGDVPHICESVERAGSSILGERLEDEDNDRGLKGSEHARPMGRRKRVLELGCGHGFPGIMALRQDFNSEVLEEVTFPNVHLNVQKHLWDLAEYYSGDWSSLSPLLTKRDEGGLFDLILTAETLYTTAVAEKVLEMILKHLAPGGQALVASKRFYFGTGGSTQHFRERAAADGRLVCADAAVIDTGKGNIREILQVSWERRQG